MGVRMRVRMLLLVLVGTTFPTAVLAATPRGASASKPEVIQVDWCVPQKTGPCAVEHTLPARIGADTPVVLEVRNFNFIGYKLEHRVEETAIEAYQELDKLWSQLLGFPGLFGALAKGESVPCATMAHCLVDWNALLIQKREDLEKRIGAFREMGAGIDLGDVATRTAVDAAITATRANRSQIEAAREAAVAKLRDAPNLELQAQYVAVRQGHVALVEVMDAFLRNAQRTLDGERRVLGKKKAGTVVAVTLEASGSKAASHSLEYFVHSRFPVLFHAGYVFSGLRATAFDKVRTAAGNDLFSQVKAQEATSDLTAFLSYEVQDWGDGQGGFLVGLGTGLASPGDTLYAVASIRVAKRVFLSAGVGSNVVEEGSGAVASRVAEGLGVRELFAAVSTRRQWRGFAGVSFSPF